MSTLANVNGRRISRRALLRGAGGAAVALPFLEIMGTPKAGAATDARYFVFVYGGISLGDIKEAITPATAGTGFEMTRGLRPLWGNSVNDKWTGGLGYPDVHADFSVVSGLKVPWEAGAPGRRGTTWHGCTKSPIAAGVNSVDKGQELLGPSADYLVHKAIGGNKLHLRYRVQPVPYVTENPVHGVVSAGLDAAGKLALLTPVSSPTQAHRQLFQGFQPTDAAELAAWQEVHEQKKSVIDLVRRSTERLERRLGTTDRQRLQRHFDEIRAVETRLSLVEAPQSSIASRGCVKPAEPVTPPEATASSRGPNAWSDEETRGLVRRRDEGQADDGPRLSWNRLRSGPINKHRDDLDHLLHDRQIPGRDG
jgi:hypothetical protein